MSKGPARALSRVAFSIAVAVAFVGLAGGPARAQQQQQRIVVAPVVAKGAEAGFSQRVGRAIAEGLIASGADLAPLPAGAAPLDVDGCATAACFAAFGRDAKATMVLQARVQVEGRSYSFAMAMADGRTGSVLGRRENRCDICTEAEALELASSAASTLKAEVARSAPPVALPSPAVAAGGDEQALPSRGPDAPAPERANGGSGLRVLSWVGIGVGVAAVVAGAVLLHLDGQGTCSLSGDQTQCRNLYDTKAGGYALLGGGILVAGLSTWGVVASYHDGSTNVAIAGRF